MSLVILYTALCNTRFSVSFTNLLHSY